MQHLNHENKDGYLNAYAPNADFRARLIDVVLGLIKEHNPATRVKYVSVAKKIDEVLSSQNLKPAFVESGN